MMAKLMKSDVKPIVKDARNGDILHSTFDNTKMIDILVYSPQYPLEKGLMETIEYYSNK
jgi:UDP-glucose 4-epimerase